MAQGFYKSGLKMSVQKPDNSAYKSVNETNNLIKKSLTAYNQTAFKSKTAYGNSLRNGITEELRKQYGHKG